MMLPAGVNKGTGLRAALDQLNLSPQAAVGIGDAENDQAFLDRCGCAVVVDNALPALKNFADFVTRGAGSRRGGIDRRTDPRRPGFARAADSFSPGTATGQRRPAAGIIPSKRG